MEQFALYFCGTLLRFNKLQQEMVMPDSPIPIQRKPDNDRRYTRRFPRICPICAYFGTLSRLAQKYSQFGWDLPPA